MTPNHALVYDGNVGQAALVLEIDYDQAMDSTAPTVAFTPAVSSTLSYNSASSGWNTAGTIFYARYNVADANVSVAAIDVDVTGATDATSHQPQAAYNGSNNFSIDTQNPATPTINGLLNDTNFGWDGVTYDPTLDMSGRRRAEPSSTGSRLPARPASMGTGATIRRRRARSRSRSGRRMPPATIAVRRPRWTTPSTISTRRSPRSP